MNLKAVTTTALALTASFLLLGCQETEQDLIGDAQHCLDHTTMGQAEGCLSKIEGLTSNQSYVIRCAASFIDEGLTDPAKLSDALNQVSDGNSNSIGLLQALAFKNATRAQTMFERCSASKQKGLLLISGVSKMATDILNLTTGSTGISVDADGNLNISDDPNEIAEAIEDLLLAGGSSLEVVGTTLQVVYNGSCQSGNQANQDICGELDTALASVDLEDPAAIGNAILDYWKNNN